MNKLKYLLISVLAFLLFIPITKAAFTDKSKLLEEGGGVLTDYSVEQVIIKSDGTGTPDTMIGTDETFEYVMDYFNVHIYNLTENIYAEVVNDAYPEDKRTYRYTESDKGHVAIKWTELDKLATYTIKIYAEAGTGYEGELLATKFVALPRYNEYSEYGLCSAIPEYFMCKKYVFSDKQWSFTDFNAKVTEEIDRQIEIKEKEEANAIWYNAMFNFIKEHKVAFITFGAILVVTAGVIAVLIIRKRRSSAI